MKVTNNLAERWKRLGSGWEQTLEWSDTRSILVAEQEGVLMGHTGSMRERKGSRVPTPRLWSCTGQRGRLQKKQVWKLGVRCKFNNVNAIFKWRGQVGSWICMDLEFRERLKVEMYTWDSSALRCI